jgi:HSP20 family protein
MEVPMSLVRNPHPFAAPVVRRSLAEDLFDGFERLFEDVGRGDANGLAMDFYETEDALVLELAVPGVTSSGIDVSVEGRQLTVRAELPAAPEGEARRYWLRSLPRGAYTRAVRLPMGVDVEAIEARVQNGVLNLRMPKAAEAKVRKLQIQEG